MARVAMRQLLGRKSMPKLSDQDNSDSTQGAFQPAKEPAGERVFPLRNGRGERVISRSTMNAKTDALKNDSERGDYLEFPLPPRAVTPLSHHSGGTTDSEEQRRVSERNRFSSGAQDAPRVVTGIIANDGNVAYRRCEDEPIRTPGAIQSFGALVGLKYTNSGNLEVRIASENTRKILGYGPEQLFTLTSFLDILKHDVRDEMLARIKHTLSNPEAINQETRLDVFQLTLTFPYEPDLRLWCAIHLAPSPEGLVVCEFEDYSDSFYLRDKGSSKILPNKPVGLIDLDVSPEEFKKSITSASKPLKVLEIAHQTQNKTFSSLDLFSAMAQAQQQISGAKSVQLLLEILVGLISELTGFHRVMVYRFDSLKNGCVDAELVNHQACTDIFRGMHFPASDIPKQARELYKTNRIRVLYDRAAETARLVCRNEKDFERPLDLTHSYLRAMSPVHNKYLANMGVRSSMSISIMIDSELWGLVACHGYGDIGMRVSLPLREVCKSIGECAGFHIQRLLTQQRLASRRPTPNLNTSSQNPASFLASSSSDLLKLVDADFALLNFEDKLRTIGKLDPHREAMALLSYLQSCHFTQLKCSANIGADFPGFSYAPGLKTICGLLLIPLNTSEGNDFLVFFRKGQEKLVKWAGNPHEKTFKVGSKYLEPRSSFTRWVETIEGTSREWTEDQLDTASLLGMLYTQYGRFKSAETDESNGQPLEETFNLNLIVSKLKSHLQRESQRKRLDLTISTSKQLPTIVKGDPEPLRQLILYFIGNAFKQSSNVKVVIDVISTKEDTSTVGLSFQDNGLGMSEEQLDEIFQEFEEAQDEENWPLHTKQPATNSCDGNGETVDLSVVARYVRNMNGQIRVASEEIRGNTFCVELPFQIPAITTAAKPRKFRNLFLPSAGLPKTPAPNPPRGGRHLKSPQSPPEDLRDGLQTPTPTEQVFPYRHHFEEDHNPIHDAYDHARRRHVIDGYRGDEILPYPDTDEPTIIDAEMRNVFGR